MFPALDVNTRLHGRTDDAARVLVSKYIFDIFMVVPFLKRVTLRRRSRSILQWK